MPIINIYTKENEKDLSEVPENVKKGLDIRPVKWIDEVLALALERAPVALNEDEDLDEEEATPVTAPVAATVEEEDSNPTRPH